MEHRLHELIFTLALVSLVSWSLVGITAIARSAARLRYRQRSRTRVPLSQATEEAAE